MSETSTGQQRDCWGSNDCSCIDLSVLIIFFLGSYLCVCMWISYPSVLKIPVLWPVELKTRYFDTFVNKETGIYFRFTNDLNI